MHKSFKYFKSLYVLDRSCALAFRLHLIFGQVGAKPEHYRSCTGDPAASRTCLSPLWLRHFIAGGATASSSWFLLDLFILPTYWSIKLPYLSRAFASLTFIVVIRCASQELYYYLGLRVTISSACLVHLLFLHSLCKDNFYLIFITILYTISWALASNFFN